MNDINLKDIGWDDWFEGEFNRYRDKAYLPARVAARTAMHYELLTHTGRFKGLLSGKFLHRQRSGGELPVVGDWVAVDRKGENALVEVLLPRKSCFCRKPAISGGRKLVNRLIAGGATTGQVLAANIDTVFIVSVPNENFSIPGLDRYLTAATAGNVSPVIVLNKTDIWPDAGQTAAGIKALLSGCHVHAVSAATGVGMESLAVYLKPGQTVAFLGPSGAGKSTLINRLFGEDIRMVNSVNANTGKGRHTTTMAELLLHESGCMLIDSPGIRELQLWCEESDVEENFNDVVEIIRCCRFSDCVHGNEPGCAVREALANGSLSRERFQSYLKLHSEAGRLELRKRQLNSHLRRIEKYSGKD